MFSTKFHRRSRRRATLASLALAIMAFVSPAGAEEKTAKLVVAADVWCPINCSPAEGKEGIGIELARKIFEPLGYEIEYRIMPWSRALEEVRAGTVDAVVGANRTDEPKLVFPKTPIIGIADDFFVRADDPWRFKTIESLQSRRLGIIRGYGYDEPLTGHIVASRKIPGKVQEVGGDSALQQNIRKLLADRINVLVESRAVVHYNLKKMGLSDKIVWAGGLPLGDVYLAFSPARQESRKRAQQFDEGISKLRKEETLESIYGAYGLQP